MTTFITEVNTIQDYPLICYKMNNLVFSNPKNLNVDFPKFNI